MTGQKASTHGIFENTAAPLIGPTLPGELGAAGYQTHLVGKLHLSPPRKRYGFQSTDWADSPRATEDNDYQRFLRRENVPGLLSSDAHGLDQNGWVVQPWHLDERLHFTNWCVDRAIEFLERRDPTCPFFLNVSLFHPHQPLTPPKEYYDRYMAMNLPEPYVGDWARVYDKPVRGLPVDSWRVCLDPAVMKQYRAAYYASINHIDSQIGRLLKVIPEDTVILFTSDHGEMLGDHQWIRKRNAYEPSVRIPFIMKLPRSMGFPQQKALFETVELMDIMPTLLDLAGVPIPDTVDGETLVPLLRDDPDVSWREYVHGECGHIPTLNSGMQYLTNGDWKYIWFRSRDVEQLFNLQADPHEMNDLASQPEYAAELNYWRSLLIRELLGRPEGFTDGQKLLAAAG